MQSVLDRNNFIMIDSIVSSTFSSSKSISLFRARKMFQWSAIILLSLLSSQATYAFWGDSNSIDSFHNDPNSMKEQQQQQQQQKQSSVYHHKSRDMQLEDLLSQGEEKCLNKPCVQSEQCCPGSVCVDLHSTIGKHSITGTCLPIYGLNEGDSCSDDSDCENGLRCMPNLIDPSLATVSGVPTSMFTSSRTLDRLDFSNQQQTCQPPGQEMLKKQYNVDCTTSSECDASRQLCCQLIKRHRMMPRKACLYFSDPNICLGPVDITFVKQIDNQNRGHYPITEQDYFRARIG